MTVPATLETPTRMDLLALAWRQPFTTKSDTARVHADQIASLASDGFITTRQAAGLYGNIWKVTVAGLKFLELMNAIVEDDS